MPKNAQTTTQLHSSHMLAKLCSKFQARLQPYVNHEFPDIQAGFRKGRGTRAQIANIHWIMEKAREFQKNIYFSFIDYAKAFDCLWWVWGLSLNAISPLLLSCWGFSFAFGCGVSFLGEIQHSLVDGCSAASGNFGVLAGEDECTFFYPAIF